MFFDKKEPAVYAVIGLGRFGTAVAETLTENGNQVIIVDKDADRVRELRYLTDYAYVVNHLDQKSLEEIGVGECQVAIVCIGAQIDANILAVLHCLNLKVPRVIAKANSKDQGQILEKLGAEVVYPEREMGIRLANQLSNKKIVDYLSISGNIDLAQIKVPDNFVGRKLSDVDLRKNWGISVIAIQNGNETIEEIEPGYTFKNNDTIIVIGSNDNIRHFEQRMGD